MDTETYTLPKQHTPFLQGGVVDSGYGDYTKERHTWLDNLSIEEISSEIKP
jgi:hypothetical protein